MWWEMSIGTTGAAHALYRSASSQIVGYPLLMAWQRGWLPVPRSEGTARFKDGRLLSFDLGDRTQRTMYLGLFEPEETSLVQEILRPGDVFVDVGAHVGWFATLAARRVGPAGRVLACEPYPPNAARLRQNLARNQCENVQIVGAAVGSVAGTLNLAAGGDSGSVTALDWAQDDRISVPVLTLDDVTEGQENIALIKVDVEGWEPHVLRGACSTLSRTQRVLIEINRPALSKAGSSQDELVSLLRQSGFVNFRRVAATGLRRLRRSEVGNLLASR
jgi:FkbM family methyltransferase